ncbi:VanZ like family protein [Fibrobacter sp. UWH9]|nr:VanZ family protein [Fibrobacter sp. UWH5]SHG74503.1 VanZ like family protein [Fibrobacter sp. UWH9]SHK58253.1 VanZ like family protein [Fibrobacter sp. UWH5]
MFESLFQKYPFFRKIPAILCMAIIFKLSSMTSAELEGLPHVWDKLAHTCEYATLAGCFCMWWTRGQWTAKSWFRVVIVMLLALAYGCTDEYHQRFVEGRSCDAMDLIADTLGGLIGGSVYVLIVKILNRYDPLPQTESDESPDSEESL